MIEFREKDFPLLIKAGYVVTDTAIVLPNTNLKIENHDLATHMEGRLHNAIYMGAAIDFFDGIFDDFDLGNPDETKNIRGTKQFAHLMNHHDVWLGYLYVALRRFQRNGENARLRALLPLIFAHEEKKVSGRDVLETFAPDLVQKEDIRYDNSEKEQARLSHSEVKMIEG